MLGDVNKPFVFKSLLITPSNVLPLHLKQSFQRIIWIFTEGEGDLIKSRLPFKIFSTLYAVEKWWFPLKCGFCKKSFIMNDFLQNPHSSQKCHFWSYFMLKLFVNIWYTSSTSQSTQASFLHKPHGVSMLTFDSFWLFNQNQNKHKQHGVSNGY